MRDRETIDSELRLLAAVRRALTDKGAPAPTMQPVDEPLDERRSRGMSQPGSRSRRG